MSLFVGLDIGTSAVRAALLQGGKKGAPVLKKYGEVALPPGAVDGGEVVEPDVVREAITQLWKRAKLPKKNVVLGLANQRIIVRPIDVPALSDEALRQSLAVHVADFIPMSVDKAVLDFMPLGGSMSESRTLESGEDGPAELGTRPILVVAAQREMVDGLIEVVEGAGLTIVALDLQAFALVRAVYGARIPLGEPPEAIVSIGAGLTQVVITKDGEAVFFRLVPFGGNEFTDALTNGLGIDRDEAEELKRRVGVRALDTESGVLESQDDRAREILTRTANRLIDEIRGSLEFYSSTQGGDPVSELKISGNAARLPHLAARLGRFLEIRLTPVKLLGESVEVGRTGLSEDQLAQAQPVLPVAVGLAEWGLV